MLTARGAQKPMLGASVLGKEEFLFVTSSGKETGGKAPTRVPDPGFGRDSKRIQHHTVLDSGPFAPGSPRPGSYQVPVLGFTRVTCKWGTRGLNFGFRSRWEQDRAGLSCFYGYTCL